MAEPNAIGPNTVLDPGQEKLRFLANSVCLPISGAVLSGIYKNLDTAAKCRAYINNTYGGVTFDSDLTKAMYGSGLDRFVDSITEAVRQNGQNANAADAQAETKVLFSALNSLSAEVKALSGKLRTILAGYHAIGVVAGVDDVVDVYFPGKGVADLQTFATSLNMPAFGNDYPREVDRKSVIIRAMAAKSFKYGFNSSVALDAPVAGDGAGPLRPAWAKSPSTVWNSLWGKVSGDDDDSSDSSDGEHDDSASVSEDVSTAKARDDDDDIIAGDEFTQQDLDDVVELGESISNASFFDDNALALSSITGVDLQRAIENKKAEIVLKKITENPRLYKILNSLDIDVLRKNSPLLALSLQEGDKFVSQPDTPETRDYKRLLIRNKKFLEDATAGKVGPNPFSENNVLKYLVPAVAARRSRKKSRSK